MTQKEMLSGLKRGQKVMVKIDNISKEVYNLLSPYHKYNPATVSKWNKDNRRVLVKWGNADPFWFDRDQVEKV